MHQSILWKSLLETSPQLVPSIHGHFWARFVTSLHFTVLLPDPLFFSGQSCVQRGHTTHGRDRQGHRPRLRGAPWCCIWQDGTCPILPSPLPPHSVLVMRHLGILTRMSRRQIYYMVTPKGALSKRPEPVQWYLLLAAWLLCSELALRGMSAVESHGTALPMASGEVGVAFFSGLVGRPGSLPLPSPLGPFGFVSRVQVSWVVGVIKPLI